MEEAIKFKLLFISKKYFGYRIFKWKWKFKLHCSIVSFSKILIVQVLFVFVVETYFETSKFELNRKSLIPTIHS